MKPDHDAKTATGREERLDAMTTRNFESQLDSLLELFTILDDVRLQDDEINARVSSGKELLNQTQEPALSIVSTDKSAAIEALLRDLQVAALESLADNIQSFLDGKIEEKLPGSGDRYPGKLESCLSPILKLQFGSSPSQVLADIYYRLVKNHPFLDGNKKIAAGFLAISLQNVGATANLSELGNITLHVASSPSEQYEEISTQIARYIESRLNEDAK